MKYLKILALSYVFVAFNLVAYTEAPTTAILTKPWENVVQYAQDNLPHEGQLVVKSDGYGYIKVDDAYIRDLFPMLGLSEEGYKEPPYFRRADSPGAHISVFYAGENVTPDEVGQSFPFELQDVVIVHPARGTSYAVLQVSSPALEALREKYGLKPKLNGHEFHISLAKKTVHQAKPWPNR